MIPVQLLANATYTEPTIPLIDVAPFIAGTVIGLTLSIAFLTYILRKDPTLRWRAQRRSWVYDFFKSPAGDIKILPVMEDNISENSTFDYGSKTKDNKGTYKIQDKSEDGNSVTVYTHKGHPAYFHSSDQFTPHGWKPGSNSLEAQFSPQSIYKTKDGNIRQQIDSVKVGDATPKSNWGIIALVVIVIIMVVALYEQIGGVMSFLQDKFATHTVGNSTVTCPSGYTSNTHGQCVPNGMPFTDLISILGISIPIRISMNSKNYRRYLGLDKIHALIAKMLSIVFLPAITLSLFISKTQYVNVTADTYNFDMVIIVTSVVFWISAWIIGSKIGDWIFIRNNRWSIGMNLNSARKQFKMLRKMRTYIFWLRVEKESQIENWLKFFESSRPTMTYSGGLI